MNIDPTEASADAEHRQWQAVEAPGADDDQDRPMPGFKDRRFEGEWSPDEHARSKSFSDGYTRAREF
jgi:hypothetical protein